MTDGRKRYAVNSGEGTGPGTWEIVQTADIAEYLKAERCGAVNRYAPADRWALAYHKPYLTAHGDYYAHDVETGDRTPIPAEMRDID